MENNINKNNNHARAEQTKESELNEAARSKGNLMELALKLYQCGDGNLVTNPEHCRTMNSYQLPDLSLANTESTRS
jgi:hypothetical protein